MLKNKNKFTDRDLWVLQKPDFFSVIHYRNKIRHSVSSYKEALKLARKIGDTWQNQCLVYAVRDTAQINLNHRKIYKQTN
jgi:propanediol dehydratase small subunit